MGVRRVFLSTSSLLLRKREIREVKSPPRDICGRIELSSKRK